MDPSMMRRRLLTGTAAFAAFTSRPLIGAGAVIAAPANAQSAAIAVGGKPRSVRLTAPPSYDADQFSTFGGATKSRLIQLPADVDFVRLVFGNQTGSSFTLNAYIAPTARAGNGWAPYKADGTVDTTLFRSVTFNGTGADRNPEDNPGTAAPLATIPANTAIFYSDWMRVSGTMPRIDSADPQRLLLVRTASQSGMGWGSHTNNIGLLTDPANVGGVSACFSSRTSIATLTASDFVADNYTHITGIQFVSRVPGYTVSYCGSSIVSGVTTTNGRSCFPRIACHALSIATGVPFVAFANIANGIPVTPLVAASTLVNIAASKPDFVLIQVANRNDAHTVAQQDITWRYVREIADATTRNGGTPILVTCTPWPPANAPDAATDNIRQINNIRARQSGLPCFDYDALLSDGGSPARLLPIYNDTGDQTHPGNTGHAYAATFLASLLRTLTTT